SMQDNFAHCENLVREADKDRYLAALFAPAEHRPALFALYAFDVEIKQVPGRVMNPLAGEVRLEWWREWLAGNRLDEARGTPAAAALLDVIARYQLPVRLLDAIVEAHSFDLYDEPVATLEDLERYVTTTSSR